MDNELIKIDKEDIKRLIYTVRGIQIMLDFDLAKLYEVKTKRLNEQVRRKWEDSQRVLCLSSLDQKWMSWLQNATTLSHSRNYKTK